MAPNSQDNIPLDKESVSKTIETTSENSCIKLPSIAECLSKLPSIKETHPNSSPQKRQRSEYDMLLFAQYPTQIANIYKNSHQNPRIITNHNRYNNTENYLLDLANVALCVNPSIKYTSEVSKISLSDSFSRSRSIVAAKVHHKEPKLVLNDSSIRTISNQDAISTALVQNYSQKQKKKRVHMCKWENCYRIFPSLSRLLRHENAHFNNSSKNNQHKDTESNFERLTWNISN